MGRDRFLTGILIGIAALVVLALVLFFVRQGQTGYTDDSTPAGVVQNYVLAIQQGDYEHAHGYLAEHSGKPSLLKFREPFQSYMGQAVRDVAVEIGETTLDEGGQTATVQMVFLRGSGGDIFGSTTREFQSAALVRQGSAWKIRSIPYPFWDYSWEYLPPTPTQ